MSDSDTTQKFILYRYTPSLVAAAFFLGLFAISTVMHAIQVRRSGAKYFTAFVVGGCFQIVGYAARVLAHSHKDNVGIYSIQTLFILLAPPLYAASIYVILGRLITQLGAERYSLVRVAWMTKFFVTGDVIAFVAQAGGGSIMAIKKLKDAYEIGSHVAVGGLAVQLVFFTFFIITCAVFNIRTRHIPSGTMMITSPTSTATKSGGSGGRGNQANGRSWKTLMAVLYVTSVLILIRSVYRLIEYVQGNDGALVSHEVYMYVFDSTLMFLTMAILNIWHPSKFLVQPSALAAKDNVAMGSRLYTDARLVQTGYNV